MVNVTYSVIPNPKGGWDVFMDASAEVVYHHAEKQAAVEKAREICMAAGADLFVHSSDGRQRVLESFSDGKR